MDTYGLPNEDRTDIVHEVDNDDGRAKLVGGRRGTKFPTAWYADNGYLPTVPPALGLFQSLGAAVVGADSYTREIVNAPDEEVRPVQIYRAEAKSDALVDALAPPRKVQRAIAKGASLNRKKLKHLADPARFPDLTAKQEAEALALEAMQEATEAIREAEDAITEQINQAAGQALRDFDVDGAPEWPQEAP